MKIINEKPHDYDPECIEVLETFDEDTQPKPDIVTKDKVKIHGAMQRDNPKPCMSAGATEAAISEDEELASEDCPECIYDCNTVSYDQRIMLGCDSCGGRVISPQCKPDQEVD